MTPIESHVVQRKPPPSFEVRLVGTNLRPWSVPMRALSRALQAVQRLIEGDQPESAEEGESAPGHDQTHGSLHLLSVTSGSAKYGVAADDSAIAVAALRLAGGAIDAPGTADWTQPLLSAIEDLSGVARTLGCTIEFRHPGKSGAVLATIKPETFGLVSSTAFVTGESSVIGTVERVGGATEMHCGLRVPSQPDRMVICRVDNAELVRELGKYVYQPVIVSGPVTWLRAGWRIRHVHVRSVSPAKRASVQQTLAEMRRIGGSDWARIDDPDRFIMEMRSH